MQHVYLSDRLFVALVKRLGVSRKRLGALRARQERQLRKGVEITLFSTARLEGLLDAEGAARLVGYARRAIRRHPKYRRDLIEVRGPRRQARPRSASAVSPRSLEPTTQAAPALGYHATPLRAEPIRGTESVDIASLLRGEPAPPPTSGALVADDSPFAQSAHSFDSGSGFGVHSEVGRDVSGIAEDSSLFAVADWDACANFEADPFAAAGPDPFAASADPFAASVDLFAAPDPFAPAGDDAFSGGMGYQDPFAAAARAEHSDPFAAAARGNYADPFAAAAQAGPPADWLGRDSAEFDPFGPAM